MAPFTRFTAVLGEPGTDLLCLVYSEIQSPPHQKALAEEIAERCRHNPERLAPGLADPRWYVVRNIVQILGAIGGAPVVGMLRAVSRHPEARVRVEVVNALKKVEGRYARPVLTDMLQQADARMFTAILHQLSQERDPATAQMLLAMVLDPEFEARAVEEKRAIYSALSTTAGDEVMPELEGELHKGNWFTRVNETHRQAIARCIARIGTPLAREALEGGARSRRGPVRKACEDALLRFGE
jgi:HEAT repeat protein